MTLTPEGSVDGRAKILKSVWDATPWSGTRDGELEICEGITILCFCTRLVQAVAVDGNRDRTSDGRVEYVGSQAPI